MMGGSRSSSKSGEHILFVQLPDDALYKVMSFLDAGCLCNMRTLNRKFRKLASKNSAGWDHLCRHLWREKVHVSSQAREKLHRVSRDGEAEIAMDAYKLSVIDGNNRDYLTREELIFDPETGKGTIWSFRFKEAAGTDWTIFDPWYAYKPCRKMVFLADGRVKTYVPRNNKRRQGRNENNSNSHVDGDEESSRDMVIDDDDSDERPLLVNPRYDESTQEINATDGDLLDPAVPMTWRFVTHPLDFPARPVGSYIRFSVMGREVPTYVCRRSPTNNWGFVMESCWGVYASFELPPRPSPGSNHGMVRRRRRRQRRLRRSLNLQQGREIHFQVEIEDSSDDDDFPEEGISGEDALVYDDNFNVTTERQWREAFLYNNFAFSVLPEGSDALGEFQRDYGV